MSSSLRSVLVLSCSACLRFPNGLFLINLPTQLLYISCLSYAFCILYRINLLHRITLSVNYAISEDYHHIFNSCLLLLFRLYLPTYLLTYLLTPYSRVLLEKLTGSAASQEIPRIFGTRRFLTVPTSARHLSLS